MENNKINVSGSNGNNDIYITTSQNSENITVDTNRSSISINATNNNALHYSNKAKEYAEASKQSAEESKESADKAESALNQILNNEDLKKVSANEENINTVANDIENVNFVGENIEDITKLVTNLENLGDTTNINIVATNINDVNTVANNIEDIKTTNQNLININYVAENIEDIATVESNKNIVLEQTAIATEQANIATEQANIATEQAGIAITYTDVAVHSSYNSKASERASATSANNAKVWAEGTDEEVQALGGEHSSKVWSEISADKHTLWGNILGDIKEQTDLQTVLDNKQDVLTAGENIEIVDNVISATGGGFNLFDTKLSDHILEGDEAKGWALQGTYVYKEGVSGVRDGYPDFYNKVVEKYNNSLENKFTFKEYVSSNVLEVRESNYNTLQENNGVYSGFTSDDYITLPTPFNPNTETWEFVTKITTGDLSAINMIIGCTTKFKSGISVFIENSKLTCRAGSNGTSWGIADQDGTTTFIANTPYWFKVEFTGSEYNVYYSTDGLVWSLEITVSSTTAIYQGEYKWVLGSGIIGRDDWYIKTQSLDLNESYININGERWWTGCNYYEFDYSVNANGHAFYDISQKDKVDEVFNVTGLAWLYGVDTENERIFLPRNVWFEQMTGDTSQVGNSVEAGLPNITGFFRDGSGLAEEVSGAIYHINNTANTYKTKTDGGADSNYTNSKVGFNASLSNNIYGNSDTVQPNAIKKLLYICVGNTNVESAITDVIDVTTTENDTMPLFTGMYFDFTPNNASWLKAGGQANSGDIYTTCYNELVNCLNGVNKYNLKVINIADMLSDVDYSEYWKVNQEELYFITPTVAGLVNALTEQLQDKARFLVAKKEPTDSDSTWYNLYSDGWLEQGGLCAYVANTATVNLLKTYQNTSYCVCLTDYDKSDTGGLAASSGLASQTVSTFTISTTSEADGGIYWEAKGYTEIPDISEYTEPINLYFKVANAVQNLELLNVGEVLETVNDFNISKANTDLSNCTKPYVIEVSDKSILPSWYRVYSDGWCEQGGLVAGGSSTDDVTLLRNFVDINYSVITTHNYTATIANYGSVVNIVDNSSFTIYSNGSGAQKCNKIWQASGYIS